MRALLSACLVASVVSEAGAARSAAAPEAYACLDDPRMTGKG